MRLFEMEKWPEKAGLATLEFIRDKDEGPPTREKYVISIPQRPETEFFTIKGGEQFILKCHVWEGSSYNRKLRTAYYFGGTDERPFLVEIEPKAFKYFAFGGEEGLFEALKPELITWLERLWGKNRTNRQGDIFAYTLPAQGSIEVTAPGGWWLYILQQWESRNATIALSNSKEQLFGTRHIFRGRKAVVSIDGIEEEIPVAEGKIEAPDHSPLLLRGPHVLAQAALLAHPKEAD